MTLYRGFTDCERMCSGNAEARAERSKKEMSGRRIVEVEDGRRETGQGVNMPALSLYEDQN